MEVEAHPRLLSGWRSASETNFFLYVASIPAFKLEEELVLFVVAVVFGLVLAAFIVVVAMTFSTIKRAINVGGQLAFLAKSTIEQPFK